jgi:excisionase family DNA binding protein
MLTTEQAADILNVSHAFLVGLLESGAIDHSTISGQHRIREEHLLAYKRVRDTKRAAALRALAMIDLDRID